MHTYFLKRLLQAIPILLGVSILIFYVMHKAPGDPFTFLIDPSLDPDSFKRLAEEYGLNKPLHVQYWNWLKLVLQGDLGYSIRFQRPVVDMLLGRLAPTVLLTGSALFLAIIIAIPLGVISATRQYSIFDYSVSGIAFMGISLPTFFTALLGIYFFGVTLRWFPLGGMMTPGLEGPDGPIQFGDRLYHLMLPMLTLAVRDMASLVRFSRSSMLEVLRQDYVRTARAKGLRERVVLFKHAFRNGLIPLITIFGLSLADLFSGALTIEILFVWPGIGLMAFESVVNRDYPVIIAINLVAATLVIVGNMIADFMYAVADPRIRFS